ncbi:hypothetical protein TcCL_NonESM05254 [Trypanosoma cruzi]|nr:hypothetical protein TcCL_NonESM05254 [Trypanosoma cruzi]
MTVHCWQGTIVLRFHPATENYASCVTRLQARGAPTPKRWACCPMTLPLHRGPRSATDHPLTKEKAQWSGHCSVRTTQQKHPQRTNALECPSEGASGLAVKPTDTGEPPALHVSNGAIERAVLQGTSKIPFSSPSVRARQSCHHPSPSQSIPQGPLTKYRHTAICHRISALHTAQNKIFPTSRTAVKTSITMSNTRVVCAAFHRNTLSSVGSGLCHTTRNRCNITYTQQSEIRKNIVIQDATSTGPVSSCCGHIPRNMIHTHRELVVQLHK